MSSSVAPLPLRPSATLPRSRGRIASADAANSEVYVRGELTLDELGQRDSRALRCRLILKASDAGVVHPVQFEPAGSNASSTIKRCSRGRAGVFADLDTWASERLEASADDASL